MAVGDKDLVLNTGRIAYGFDGTNAYPLLVDSSGKQLLGAGTSLVGKVGIDQTTPGTTNAVDIVPVKTVQTELLATVAVAASAQATSSVLALTGVKKATFFIDHGRAATTAFGTNGTEYRIEASQKATGNDTWVPLASVVANATAAYAIVVSGTTTAAGTAVIAVASTVATEIASVGDAVFWANTTAGSATNSEWLKVVAVAAGTSMTIHDVLTYAHLSSATVYTKGERFAVSLDTSAITRARVCVNNAASGTTYAIYSRVACITES